MRTRSGLTLDLDDLLSQSDRSPSSIAIGDGEDTVAHLDAAWLLERRQASFAVKHRSWPGCGEAARPTGLSNENGPNSMPFLRSG